MLSPSPQNHNKGRSDAYPTVPEMSCVIHFFPNRPLPAKDYLLPHPPESLLQFLTEITVLRTLRLLH
jgi:hypothetical protein